MKKTNTPWSYRKADCRRSTAKNKRPENISIWNAVAVIITCFTGYLIISDNYICILYDIFGIPCAGCGMTRAFKALLRLNIRAAIEHHCLFPIPIFWVLYILFGGKRAISKKTEAALMISSVALFLIRWIIILIIT